MPHPRERLGHRGVRRHDHRLGRHDAAGGVVLVRQQPADGSGVLGLNQLEKTLLIGLRQLAQQVGRVVVVHCLEHVRGPFVGQPLEQGDLLVLGHLLQDVGQPLVVQRHGHLDAALVGHVEQRGGGVGRAQIRQHGQHGVGALPRLGQREPVDLVPVDL